MTGRSWSFGRNCESHSKKSEIDARCHFFKAIQWARLDSVPGRFWQMGLMFIPSLPASTSLSCSVSISQSELSCLQVQIFLLFSEMDLSVLRVLSVTVVLFFGTSCPLTWDQLHTDQPIHLKTDSKPFITFCLFITAIILSSVLSTLSFHVMKFAI